MASQSRSITAGITPAPSWPELSHQHNAIQADAAQLLLFGGLDGCSLRDSGQSGPGDTSVVVHLGRHHLRARREMGEELLGLLAYAAADDDEVWPEEELDSVEVLVEAPGVLFPAQVIALAGAVCGAVLGVLAPDLDVSELGVRHQPAAYEEGGADSSTQREHQDDAVLISACAPAHLCETGCVSIVDDAHGGVELSK